MRYWLAKGGLSYSGVAADEHDGRSDDRGDAPHRERHGGGGNVEDEAANLPTVAVADRRLFATAVPQARPPRAIIAITALETIVTAATTVVCIAAAAVIPTALYVIGFQRREGLDVPICRDLSAALLVTGSFSVAMFAMRVTPLL